MIVVKVELHSAITGRVSELARMVIHNVGGTRTKGDYGVATFRGRDSESLQAHMVAWLRKEKSPQRGGRVEGHARLSEHVWRLVAKALKAVDYAA